MYIYSEFVRLYIRVYSTHTCMHIFVYVYICIVTVCVYVSVFSQFYDILTHTCQGFNFQKYFHTKKNVHTQKRQTHIREKIVRKVKNIFVYFKFIINI